MGQNDFIQEEFPLSDYIPPFHITDEIIFLVAEISEQIGRIAVLQEDTINPRLRRENRIRTIHSSLAIEHNSLSLEQDVAAESRVHRGSVERSSTYDERTYSGKWEVPIRQCRYF